MEEKLFHFLEKNGINILGFYGRPYFLSLDRNAAARPDRTTSAPGRRPVLFYFFCNFLGGDQRHPFLVLDHTIERDVPVNRGGHRFNFQVAFSRKNPAGLRQRALRVPRKFDQST
jgi:hypothetical protein